MRHFWLDRIVHLEAGVRATGIKAVALAEDEFDSHFPVGGKGGPATGRPFPFSPFSNAAEALYRLHPQNNGSAAR